MKRFKWLAWGGFVLTAIVCAGAVLLAFVPLPGQHSALDAALNGVLGSLVNLLFALVGAVVAANRRQNPIGWLLIGIGFVAAAASFLTNYVQVAFWTGTETLAGGLLAAWAAGWFWILIFVVLILLLHLFPTGTFLSRRWRWVAGGSVLEFLGFMTFLALGTPITVTTSQGTLNLANPIGLFVASDYSSVPPLFFIAFSVPILAAPGSLLLRFVRAHSVERQQMKWVLYAASILVIIVILSFFITGTVFSILQNLIVLGFPIAIGIAILRYRLYDIDLLINRTLVYVPLTAILAGIFSASITLSQRFFVALTGQSSDAATVLTTLIVVAAFEPLKSGLQHLVDLRFKEGLDPAKKMNALDEQMRAVLQVIDAEQMTRRVLSEAVAAFGARGGAIYLDANGSTKPAQTVGEWNGDANLSIVLQNPKDGARLGALSLATRRNGLDYAANERAILQQIADTVASAIIVTERMDGEWPPK